jgi:hypothetical protein
VDIASEHTKREDFAVDAQRTGIATATDASSRIGSADSFDSARAAIAST